MKKLRSSGEIFGLAFLDIIACGFGAMVLLLLITKPAPIRSRRRRTIPGTRAGHRGKRQIW